MANTSSAKKALRVSVRRRQRNKPLISSLKTFVKQAEAAIVSTKTEGSDDVVRALSALDRMATKGIIHHNNAARRKSRLMKKYNQSLATASA